MNDPTITQISTNSHANTPHKLLDSAIIQSVLIFAAWLLVWHVGRLVEYTEHASVWFPAAGFTFSCMMVIGKRALFPIMCAAIVVTIWNGHHYQLGLSLPALIWGGFWFGWAHILPYWAGAHFIARLANKSENNTSKLIVSFIIIAGLGALLTTVLVINSLILTNQMSTAEVSNTLLPFWIGDMAGVIVLSPIFSGLLIRSFPKPKLKLSQFLHQGIESYDRFLKKISLNAALIVLTMLLAKFTESFESSFAVFFLAITHMWIATTETPVFNVLSLAISSVLIVVLVHVLGLMNHIMVYQFAINVIAANALFGIAVPQLKAHNQTLETMVFKDALTQVASRQYMDLYVASAIEYCEQEQSTFSVVIFDLDNFKFINDNHGHAAGDLALQAVASKAQSLLPRSAVLARFGGDEFVLLLKQFNQKQAQRLSETIRQAIEQIDIESTPLSSSFGVAQWHLGESYQSLFKRADNALYQSKNNGRNQVTLA